jgi:hypothetical protein
MVLLPTTGSIFGAHILSWVVELDLVVAGFLRLWWVEPR